MPRITVDFSDVQDFEALPKGEYDGVIVKATMRNMNLEDKSPYVNLEIDVTDAEYKGRKLWTIMSLSPKALWRTKETMEELGVYQDEVDFEVSDGDEARVLDPPLEGIPVHMHVSQREYEGRTQNQVDKIERLDGPKTRGKTSGGPKKTGGSGSKTKTASAGRKFR